MKQTKGYEKAAKVLPAIIGLEEEKVNDPPMAFTYRNILINLSWALIYLDGLETNLYMIKASAPVVN
jgi:hypothetical protein